MYHYIEIFLLPFITFISTSCFSSLLSILSNISPCLLSCSVFCFQPSNKASNLRPWSFSILVTMSSSLCCLASSLSCLASSRCCPSSSLSSCCLLFLLLVFLTLKPLFLSLSGPFKPPISPSSLSSLLPPISPSSLSCRF